jgi:hypothetical protein
MQSWAKDADAVGPAALAAGVLVFLTIPFWICKDQCRRLRMRLPVPCETMKMIV